MTKKTCGDAGGRNKDGTLCRHKRVDGTLCARHDDTRMVVTEITQAAKKKLFLEEYAQGDLTLIQAAKNAGTSQATVWRLRREDPDFDASVIALAASVDQIGLKIAEDTLRKRIIDNKCTTAELIFYLINRGKGRWRHVQHLRHAGPDGGPLPTMTNQVVNIYLPHNDRETLTEVIQTKALGNGAGD